MHRKKGVTQWKDVERLESDNPRLIYQKLKEFERNEIASRCFVIKVMAVFATEPITGIENPKHTTRVILKPMIEFVVLWQVGHGYVLALNWVDPFYQTVFDQLVDMPAVKISMWAFLMSCMSMKWRLWWVQRRNA